MQSVLNNSARHCRGQRWRRYLEPRQPDEPADENNKKYTQVRQDDPLVVACAAQHRMRRIADLPLEPVSAQQRVALDVPDHRLDHLPAPE